MSGIRALVNGRVILPERIVEDKALLLEGGKIKAIARAGDLPHEVERVDMEGCFVAPGLVDIHTHGAMGRSFLDGSEESFALITETQAQRGITSLLPTTSTAPLGQILGCLERTRQWQDEQRRGSQVLGAHVEGPYFAAAQAGAQDPANLRQPDDGSVEELLEHSAAIRIVSFAPELPGALALARRLCALGIAAAIGHSSATDEEVAAAVEAGASHAIHLWSGQSTTVRRGPWRYPGILEASLASDTLSGEIIADGKHLPVTLMRLAYRCLGADRLCLVSDATSGAGLPTGKRFRMGEMEYVVDSGVGMMLDRSGFAGSTTFLDEMVRLVVDTLGLSVVEAVRMASLTPARVAGVHDRKGSIEEGKDADLVVFGPGLEPRRTMIAGRWLES